MLAMRTIVSLGTHWRLSKADAVIGNRAVDVGALDAVYPDTAVQVPVSRQNCSEPHHQCKGALVHSRAAGCSVVIVVYELI